MALPGLSFEIVNSSGAVLGIRTDRGTLIALTERGPVETPTLVRSLDEFNRVFGCALDGTLGALAANLYFKNGGQDLVVTRFVPGGATVAKGKLAVAGASGSSPVEFAAREPGTFGNRIKVQAATTIRHRGKGVVDPAGTLTFTGLTSPLFTPPGPDPEDTGDVGLPLRVVTDDADHWTRVATVSPLSGGTQTLTLVVPLPSGMFPTEAVALVYAPTFTLRVGEPGRSDVVVAGLDLRDLTASNELLASTAVVIVSASTLTAELPVSGVPVRLDGGADGLDVSGDPLALEASFRNSIAALATTDVPDIVFAPDLWSRVLATKGVRRLAFSAAQALALGDELVESAELLRDRVVLLDPPLVGPSELRPAVGTELTEWRDERGNVLAAARDFAAVYSPWLRIVAGPVYKGDDTLLFPPSAAVAGQMAKTSRDRGPWIATGNVALEGVVGLDQPLTDEDAEVLQDSGINPLRMSLPRGATIFGVRSLAWPDRKQWRFLSVRRLFNYLRRALRPIGLSYVFESNSVATWISLRRDVERLLRDLYATGALAGSRPEEAFFVKIDDSLNPEDARQNGVLTAQVGLAPAKPLEFLVVRLIVSGGITRIAEEPIVV